MSTSQTQTQRTRRGEQQSYCKTMAMKQMFVHCITSSPGHSLLLLCTASSKPGLPAPAMRCACCTPTLWLSRCNAAAEGLRSLTVHFSSLPNHQLPCTLSPSWRRRFLQAVGGAHSFALAGATSQETSTRPLAGQVRAWDLPACNEVPALRQCGHLPLSDQPVRCDVLMAKGGIVDSQ